MGKYGISRQITSFFIVMLCIVLFSGSLFIILLIVFTIKEKFMVFILLILLFLQISIR